MLGSNDLIARIATGDQSAMHDLYRDTAARHFGTCLRMLRSRHEAEEALQDSYIAIWRKASSFDPARGGAEAWMTAIVRNTAIDRLRTSGRDRNAPIAEADEVPDTAKLVSEVMEDEQGRARLIVCLEQLATLETRLLHAAFFEGSTYAELSHRSSVPLSTVKSRIRRALAKLRECLR